MRKHQQFAYTFGSPSSDILPTDDLKGYYQKFYNGYVLWLSQFAAHEVHGGILINGIILVVKMEY